ncbi:MAG: metal-dependent hydrolase [Promethearchaeota archaeon]
MDIFTHILIGVLIGILTLTKLTPEAIIFLWVMSFLPDFDVLLEPIQRIKKSYFLSHKAASHSYIIGLLFTGIISIFISLIRNAPFFQVWLAGFFGFSIHVTLDLFTASKIPIFYPLSQKEFRFIADKAINPFLAAFSGINLLVLIVYFYTYPRYQIFITLAYLYLYIYLTYFGFRAFLRTIVQIKLPKSSQYIPGLIPFYYFIHEKSEYKDVSTFKLTKKSIFSSKNTEILNQKISNHSNEMLFYKLALKVSNEFRFFHKWDAIIPFIRENEKAIKVVLILAESYSRMSSHYLSIIFNKKSLEVISKIDAFGPFKKWENLEF